MKVHTPHALLLTALGCAAVLPGCTTPAPRLGNVIPQEGGLYQVITTGKSEQSALESALYSAERTCGAEGMRHVVLDHRTEYKGLGTEAWAQTIEQVQRIILGSGGQRRTEIAGEEDYRVSMQFRCETLPR